DQHNLDDFRPAEGPCPSRRCEAVAARAENSRKNTVAIEQPAMRVLNDVLGLFDHDALRTVPQKLWARPRPQPLCRTARTKLAAWSRQLSQCRRSPVSTLLLAGWGRPSKGSIGVDEAKAIKRSVDVEPPYSDLRGWARKECSPQRKACSPSA